jgi:hypothetical protein
MCEGKFDYENKKPMVLPCNHTFCNQCIVHSWEVLSYVRCPMDNKKCLLHIDKIQTNQFMLNLITGKVKIRSDEILQVYLLNHRKVITISVRLAEENVTPLTI